jgi:TolB-like protein/tetratricopeptide (TPR) repeat protein
LPLFNELRRRNVFKVAVVYMVVSWLLLQISDTLVPALRLPDWFNSGVAFLLIIGFPVVLIFAWAFELTPDGLKKEKDVDRSQSLTHETGRKLNYGIIAILAVAVIYLGSKVLLEDDQGPAVSASVDDQSIAVLPFDNRSADSENAEFFAAGVHDELLTLLSKLGGLKVISRTSVERLDQNLSIPEIGELLGVATVLEGQVQRAGDRLRINVQLIKTQEEDHLWATTYDRELSASNIFDVQSNIARTIADELHVQLSAKDDDLLLTAPTQSTEALERFMLGRQHFDRSSWDSLRRARTYFREATEHDPEYLRAWTAIANVSGRLFGSGAEQLKEYAAAAEPAITRALELDDSFAEAHAQLARLQWRSGDLPAAEASFQRALDLDPGDVQSLFVYGNYLRSVNRPQEAIPVLEKALARDPLSPLILFELGKAETYMGYPEKNLDYAARIREIDPSSVHGYGAAMQSHIWMGRFDLAWPFMLESMQADKDDFENWAYVGLWYDMLGDPDMSDRYLDHALELGPNASAVLKCQVQILARRNMHEEALAIARRALEAGLENRWFSNQTFLRQVRREALMAGDYHEALDWYANRHPELQATIPNITIDNIQAAADLAMLLQRAGQAEHADLLIDAALAWYEKTQPPGVHGILTSIADVHLLLLRGDKTAALTTLREAVDNGWRYDWPMHINNPNLDPVRNEPEYKAIVAEIEAGMARQLNAIRALPHMGVVDLRK